MATLVAVVLRSTPLVSAYTTRRGQTVSAVFLFTTTSHGAMGPQAMHSLASCVIVTIMLVAVTTMRQWILPPAAMMLEVEVCVSNVKIILVSE